MNSVTKALSGQLGWKTITAAAVLAVLVFAQHMQWLTAQQFDQLRTLAEAFGLFGLRDAVSTPPGTG